MKESGYNFFVKYEPDNILLGYNCVSGGLLVFPGQQHDAINKTLKDPDKAEDSIIKEKLIKGRFLIDDDLDELKILKLRNKISRFNSEGTALVIAPTLHCPLECRYCYVDRDKAAMGRPTIDALKKFYLKKIERSQGASVSWTNVRPQARSLLVKMEIVDQQTA